MIFLLQREGRGKGAAAPFPCTPNPRRTSSASLRTISPGPPRLTKPNTSCTIISPASLRSDCCSPSLRNAVRLPSGIDVHLYRNTHGGVIEKSIQFEATNCTGVSVVTNALDFSCEMLQQENRLGASRIQVTASIGATLARA